jgi:hypothetical protein
MRLFIAISLLFTVSVAPGVPAPPTLKVSEDRRFLVTGEGKPFFWLGDTAWELFHRLGRADAEAYLKNRAALGFTVIQAVALAEFDGLTEPNAQGHLPLQGSDPLKPAVQEGPDNDYWDHVDWIVDKANSLGLTIGFLPSWGDKWNKKWGAGPEIFTPENAEAYGEWLGKRYKNKALVWVLGGDRPIENDTHREIIRRMALGLHKGDDGTHLHTFHPMGGQGSAQNFHEAPWLDFNMRQNGHSVEFTGKYEKTREDYARVPVKPVLDGEPIYEGHPIGFKAKEFGHSIAADVRRPLYWNLFSGACGHTYGHHSVWQMYDGKKKPVNDPLMVWTEAINEPGAAQMGIGRRLMESRPFTDFVPDQSVIVSNRVATSVPGAGRYAFVSARTKDWTCAMVYVPAGRSFSVRLEDMTGPRFKAWWFNPRNGKADAIGEYPKVKIMEFSPPSPGEELDWVLVLDDMAKDYPEPGSKPLSR